MSKASNLAGFVTSISPINNLNVGVITATSFVGDGSGLTGAGSTVADDTSTNATFYPLITTQTSGTVTASKVSTSKLSFNPSTGTLSATAFSGSGSGLTGVGPSSQDVTSASPTTTIDLSLGNVIYFTHDTDTTVAFANTSTTQEVTFIRTKDATITPRSITWPTSIKWNQLGFPPYLQSNPSGGAQTFSLITRDSGVTWYGWEEQISYGNDKYLFVWGLNNNGQLGQNNQTDRSLPIQIPGTNWNSISASRQHSLATKTDGTLWSWGYNEYGQLGQNDKIRYSSPIQIPGNTWSSVSIGQQHSLAIKTDGTLWSWGDNTQGRLGQNNQTRYSSPVQIPGITWSSISASDRNDAFSLALKTDGTLWAWGYNSGRLGQNDTIYASSPIQIPGTTWSSISAGNDHSLALKTDGTLWAWGENNNGQLGQSNTTTYSSPIQIPGTTWSSISAGGKHNLATKTDRTLWSWGYNGQGRLGQNTATQYSSPVQIPGTTWSSISGCYDFSLATKTDGTLWAWGTNQGKLGQNNTVAYSSPALVPGTPWSSVSGGQHSMATLIIT